MSLLFIRITSDGVAASHPAIIGAVKIGNYNKRERSIAMITLTEEQEIQCALFDWAEIMIKQGKYSDELKSMYHPANEGKRSNISGAILKRMGLKRGVCDVVLPAPRGGYGSLYIELKTPTGEISQEQKDFMRLMRKVGNFACVCRSWTSAAKLIEKYLKGEIVK